jgi:hypothetical protein
MKMKKMFFLMLLFLILGAAGAKAQVVIGGGDAATPDASAILELRSSNKGLLLPQVELSSTTDVSKIPTPANGLLVCNATGSLDKGVYYWSNNQWVLYIKF